MKTSCCSSMVPITCLWAGFYAEQSFIQCSLHRIYYHYNYNTSELRIASVESCSSIKEVAEMSAAVNSSNSAVILATCIATIGAKSLASWCVKKGKEVNNTYVVKIENEYHKQKQNMQSPLSCSRFSLLTIAAWHRLPVIEDVRAIHVEVSTSSLQRAPLI